MYINTLETKCYKPKDYLPSRFLNISLNDFDDTVKKMIEELGHDSLYIYGNVGSGKTHLIFTILKTFYEDRERRRKNLKAHGEVIVASEDELYINLKNCYNRILTKKEYVLVYRDYLDEKDFRLDFEIDRAYAEYLKRKDEKLFLRELSEIPILVIDDLGAAGNSAWKESSLYTIISNRELNEKQTIITSNYPLLEMKDTIGERTYSRILSMCDFFELTGNDRRISNKIKKTWGKY